MGGAFRPQFRRHKRVAGLEPIERPVFYQQMLKLITHHKLDIDNLSGLMLSNVCDTPRFHAARCKHNAVTGCLPPIAANHSCRCVIVAFFVVLVV